MFKISSKFILCGMLMQMIVGCCTGFNTYDFHDVLGRTLDDEAGEIRFDALKLPSNNFESKYTVTVQPRSSSLPKPIHVSFYYTKFDLSGLCEDMSVSVKKEDSIFIEPVKGLPEHICGQNISLEKASQVFNTSTDEFIVTFERKSSASYFKGNFTLKFIAFSLGKCDGSGVFNCSIGHCISRTYECSNDINSCADNGEHMQNCDLLKILEELGHTIFDLIRDHYWFFILIAFVVVIICSRKKIKKSCFGNYSCREGISKCGDSVTSCSEFITTWLTETRRKCSNTEYESSNSYGRRTSIQLQVVQENTRETEHDVNAELSPESISLQSSDADIPSDEERTPYMPNSPEAPPPSYDEVMASSNAKPSAPSYEEVIANRHKYETDI